MNAQQMLAYYMGIQAGIKFEASNSFRSLHILLTALAETAKAQGLGAQFNAILHDTAERVAKGR
jgi:hypothetical protein